ncbi:MAG: hypothetical protein WA857_08455 [Candidatus Acidiferrum sp.]
MRRFLIFAASLAILPALALAQGRGAARAGGSFGGHVGAGMSGMSRPAMSGRSMFAPPMRSPASRAFRFTYGGHTYSGIRYVRTRSGMLVARAPLRQVNAARTARSNRAVLSEDTVPGLGFDYAHVAAVHPGGSLGHGHGRGRNSGYFAAYFPFYGGSGYYLPLFPDDDDYEDVGEASQAAPQSNVEAEAEEPEQTETSDRPPYPQSSQDYVPAPQPAAQQNVDQYVFVRRDGTLFFAVAYAWENGALRYITSEGIRHTVPGSTLDLKATRDFNEQRGLNFTLPA